jgi:hypothetical protein
MDGQRIKRQMAAGAAALALTACGGIEKTATPAPQLTAEAKLQSVATAKPISTPQRLPENTVFVIERPDCKTDSTTKQATIFLGTNQQAEIFNRPLVVDSPGTIGVVQNSPVGSGEMFVKSLSEGHIQLNTKGQPFVVYPAKSEITITRGDQQFVLYIDKSEQNTVAGTTINIKSKCVET